MRRLILRKVPSAALAASFQPPRRPSATALRVMGIDPGTLRVGYAVLALEKGETRPRVLDFGVIRAKAGDPVDRRLGWIHRELSRLIEAWSPASVGVEAAFHGKGAMAALRIGEGRGAAIAAAASRGLPVASYPPAVVKKAITGNGAASKGQVQAMAQTLLGVDASGFPFDASDALAVALCHLWRAD